MGWSGSVAPVNEPATGLLSGSRSLEVAPWAARPDLLDKVKDGKLPVSVIGAIIDQPVAGIHLGVGAERPPLFRSLQRLPLIARGLQSGKGHSLGQERQPVATAATTPVLGVDNVAARLAGKQPHNYPHLRPTPLGHGT